MSIDQKQSILNFTPDELDTWVTERGHPRYRGSQILQWLYQGNGTSFEQMTNLSKPLRQELADSFWIDSPTLLKSGTDQGDGTLKYLLQLHDGEAIESVLMPRFKKSVKTHPQTGVVSNRSPDHIEGYTACLSTQVGCTFACKFCASGKLGFHRNMTAGEILAQVRMFQAKGLPVSRIVFMGTGEPLHNFEAVRKSIRILTSPKGMGLSPRRITVSTVGLVPEIYRMAKEGWKTKLAVSLHATTDQKRTQMMPLAKVYQLDQLKDAILFYQRCNGRRISLEYLMMDRFNDTRNDCERLKQWCEGIQCHVNLIPFNRISQAGYRPSSQDRIQRFKNHLSGGSFDVTVRYSRGRNIDAACGQLRLHHEQTRSY